MKHKLSIFPGLIILLALVVSFTLSCAGSPSVESTQGESSNLLSSSALNYPSSGASMEERIAGADVVTRATLVSVAAGTTRWFDPLRTPSTGDYYIGTLEHTFTVHEYLKGTGDDQIVALAYTVVIPDEGHDIQAKAASDAEAILAVRDTEWDDREAILFLKSDHDYAVDLPRAGYYVLGVAPATGGVHLLHDNGQKDHYTISSTAEKAWLPETLSSSAARSSSGTKSFLLHPAGESSQGQGRSPDGGTGTITLPQLKAQVGIIEQEAVDGGASEAYRDCLYLKYRQERTVSDYKQYEGDGEYFYRRSDETMKSGLPAGSLARSTARADYVRDTYDPSYAQYEVFGRDAHLFFGEFPGYANIVRPLPAGEYQFYFNIINARYIPCDGQHEDDKTTSEVFITVTAPENAVHESFFDPVSSGDAIGVFTGDGATFAIGDTDTSITGLKHEAGSVTLALSPYNALGGYELSFIGLDGTTSLVLETPAATGDAATGTLTWAAPDQPWEDGDKLMLRITEPWSGVRVELSPREDEYLPLTYTDMTISWTDPETCTAQYFVGLYADEGETVVRIWGFHPVTTTSLSKSTFIIWDSLPNNTWTARVTCTNNDWRTVGDVPLASVLPR